MKANSVKHVQLMAEIEGFPFDSASLRSGSLRVNFSSLTIILQHDVCVYYHGGEGGIRTLEPLTGLTVFKTVAIDHSATSPYSNHSER